MELIVKNNSSCLKRNESSMLLNFLSLAKVDELNSMSFHSHNKLPKQTTRLT